MNSLSDGDKQLLNNVENFGWHVIQIMEDESGPGFGYSVGFFKTYMQPEIIIAGLKLNLIKSIINNIGEQIKKGKIFQIDQFYPDLIVGFDCYFTTVENKYYREYVGYANWYL